MMQYDVLCDIHGHADKLVALLTKMGYRERLGAWRHPDRTAIFVGDFIDRGPGQLATLDIVRRMTDAGSALAVMGNHEFNAIAWSMPDPEVSGEHLRSRTDKSRRQHLAFLDEVECDSPQHREIVDWFLTLPLWLDLPQLRVVHACWHPDSMATIAPRLSDGWRIDREFVVKASRKNTTEYRAIEAMLKGLEVDLPAGHGFRDELGVWRTSARTKWWRPSESNIREAAILGPDILELLPEATVAPNAFVAYDNVKPVFVGHYWWSGQPAPMTEHVACVDYSAGDGGSLIAYRWEGETKLRADRFVSS